MNKPKIVIDKFSGTKTIDWEYVADRKSPQYGFDFEDSIVTGANNDNFSKLIFSPIYKHEANYLKLRFQDKFFKPKRGDSITFLFDDNTIEG